jgi:hypothetical protein
VHSRPASQHAAPDARGRADLLRICLTNQETTVHRLSAKLQARPCSRVHQLARQLANSAPCARMQACDATLAALKGLFPSSPAAHAAVLLEEDMELSGSL